MSLEQNPYKSPSIVDTSSQRHDGCTHEWNHRLLTVSARAASILWMDNAITVTIDDEQTHQERAFRLANSFHFEFVHDGRLAEARVKRGWGFFARRLTYELIIDGELVARSQAPVDHWERGIAAAVAVNVFVFVFVLLILELSR